jgi:uncharacterized membrane protein
MNIHPIFVHFPLALLTLYALMVLVPLRFSSKFSWWAGAASFLSVVGWLLTLPTAATGGIAEELVKGKVDPALIEMHSSFAGAIIIIFFLFFAANTVRAAKERGWGDRISARNSLFLRVWNFKQKCARVILDTFLGKVLALLGLAAILITGGLGGAIVYGPDFDPLVSAIHGLLF